MIERMVAQTMLAFKDDSRELHTIGRDTLVELCRVYLAWLDSPIVESFHPGEKVRVVAEAATPEGGNG